MVSALRDAEIEGISSTVFEDVHKACVRGNAAHHAGLVDGNLPSRIQVCHYGSTTIGEVKPSFFARRANLRSSNVATLAQDR